MRELFVTPQFRKDTRGISKEIVQRTDVLLLLLCKNPTDEKLGVKKLVGFSTSLWRIRIGAYRLIFSYDTKKIILHRIRHRRDIYRNL